MTTVRWMSQGSLVATEKNLVIVRWSTSPSAAQFKMLREASEAVASEYGGSGLLNVVVQGVPRFDEDMRTEAARISKSEGQRGLGVAHVVLLPGLAGTTVRAFLSTIALVARPKAPTSTFDALDPAARWLAERLAARVPWTGRDILRAWNSLPS